MRSIDLLTFLINCIVWIASMFRICTGQEEAFDYIVVFFSFPILAYEIYKMIEICIKKKGADQRNQEVDSVIHEMKEDCD